MNNGTIHPPTPKLSFPHVFSGNPQAIQMDSRLQPAGMTEGVNGYE